MNIRLMCAAVMVLIGTNLDAGYYTTNRLAEAIVPVASIATGLLKLDSHGGVIGAGVIGLGLVGVRYVTDRYNYKSTLIEKATKAIQVMLPLFSTLYFVDAGCVVCYEIDTTTEAYKKQAKHNNFYSKLFLGIAAVEAAIQICC